MPSSRIGFVALGLVSVAEERLSGVARFVGGTVHTVGAPIAAVAAPLVPRPLRDLVEDAMNELDQRGRAVAESGSAKGNELAEVVAGRVSQDPAVQKVVDNIVEQLPWDRVIAMVLERLAAEPEQIRILVQGQSLGMVEEITRAARERTAAGDERVDRFVSGLLRRDPGRQRRIRKQAGGVEQSEIVRPQVVDQVLPADR